MPGVGGRGLKFSVKVDPKSTREVVQNLKKTEKKIKRRVGQAIDRNTKLMVAEMKARILVDTGLAQSSTGRKLNRKDGEIIGADVYTRVKYAVFIERMKAYFVPAYNKYARQFLRDVRSIMKKP